MRRLMTALAAISGLMGQGCSRHDDIPHEHAKYIDEVAGVEKITLPVAGDHYAHLTAYHRSAKSAAGDGEKLRVIIIPGTPSDIGFWGGAIEKIDGRVEVFGIERAGFNNSGPDHAVIDLEEHAKAVGALSENFDGRLIIIGQSYGAAVALAALGRYEQSIDGVILVSPYVLPMSGWKRVWFRFARFSPLRYVRGGLTNRIVRELAAYDRQAPGVLATVQKACKPVAIIQGEIDDLVPLADAERLSGLFPNCAEVRTSIVKDGDHYLQVHSLTPLLTAINGFLGERMGDRGRKQEPSGAL